ncbi:MAG: flagellar biosynthetic protein FliO [bacterium]
MRRWRACCCLLGLLAVAGLPGAAAGTTEEGEGPSPAAGLAPAAAGESPAGAARAVGFLFLLGAAAFWCLRWNRRKNSGRDALIRVVAVKPLGQRERVAVLEIMGERMVVGVTAHGISLLGRLVGTFVPTGGEEAGKS